MVKYSAEVVEVLRKFFAAVICLLMISAQVSAMRLELYPQPIGKISSYDYNKFKFEGATIIKGDASKGTAIIGEDLYLVNNLYFHFNADNIYNRFGDCNIKNTVSVETHGDTEIFRIDSTANLPLYLLKKDSNSGDAIKIIGRRGGKWIELLNALDFREKYNIGENFYLSKFFTEDNKIIFRYTLQNDVIDVVCRWHAVNEKFYTEVFEH